MTVTPAAEAPPTAAPAGSFDVAQARRDFPILETRVHANPLVYLDNAATSQKPQSVVRALADFESLECANVHRGVHDLSQRATAAYDAVREKLRGFVNAADAAEIVLTHGTTAAINLVAWSYGRSTLKPGDEIILSEMEHHSNIVPWQLLREATGVVIKVAPVGETGELPLARFEALLGPRTRIVSVAHASNVLGTVNPIRHIAELAHAAGAILLVDGAQAAPHLRVDVRALDCDFYVASGHKMYGPTGVGFLYGRRELLERMPPWQGGGGMIASVTFERTTFAPVPGRFEAGTPPIGAVIGLGAAVEYLRGLPAAAVAAHERALLAYATELLQRVPGLRVLGSAPEKVSVLSFTMEGAHPHDIGTVLDQRGIAIRAGHHCAQPLMRRFGIPASARASFALYNTRAEVEALAVGLDAVRKLFT